MTARYLIEVTAPTGGRSILSGYGRAKGTWDSPPVSRRTARKHAREFMRAFPGHMAREVPA